jgi:hypothetical protein
MQKNMTPIPARFIYFPIVIATMVLSVWLAGCEYHNQEDLYPATCDTTNITYSQTIQPILQQNCYICHSTAIASGGVILDTPEGVQVVAQNGLLWNVVSHKSGYPAMPKDQPQLSDCLLTQINIWITAGYQVNAK